MQYQKKVALNMTMLHFRLQLTFLRVIYCLQGNHFVKLQFSEVTKMCTLLL